MATRSSYEEEQRALNPHRDEDIRRAMAETRDRLEKRGVAVATDEAPEALADLLSAVERFELQVIAKGGDLMVDDLNSREPDDPAFVLPRRNSGEDTRAYIRRIDLATAALSRLPSK
jgi:hypothetical protein